ncbi:UBAP1-MVB12-associated (UMA)-domain containing protein 1 isoform X1 [Latimeria chalumnae]|uniref:UBAP1-MVB12-associated (UMA)-domain containing protein 1 isoform X1 n=1 Tax=Latimeria chalumnae TaxID=7897 RepID=UPI00313D2D81
MLSFFGIRKSQELKKGSTPDREADGFVVLGETNNERREKMQSTAPVQVQPTYTPPLQLSSPSLSSKHACLHSLLQKPPHLLLLVQLSPTSEAQLGGSAACSHQVYSPSPPTLNLGPLSLPHRPHSSLPAPTLQQTQEVLLPQQLVVYSRVSRETILWKLFL